MYYQLSKEERFLIDKMFNQEKKSIRKIAAILNRSPSTISRELKRNTSLGYYSFEIADKKSFDRSWHNHSMFLLKHQEFLEGFKKIYNKRTNGVKATCYKLKQQGVANCLSFKQSYNLIKSYRFVIKKSERLRQYYKKGGKRKSGIFSDVKSKRVLPMWLRPRNIDSRREFGHWELDLVIGKKATGYDNLLTFVERKTRNAVVLRVKSKNSMKINSLLYKAIKERGLFVRSITIDNGIEFEKIGLLASWLDIIVYRCEPYASYQKGSNEHVNGLIRRFFKKGTSFNEISDEDIRKMEFEINSMIREKFGWKSSLEMYEKEMKKLRK